MSFSISIRTAKITDLPDVLAFDVDLLQPSPPAELRAQKLEQAIAAQEIFLAVDGDIPVGYARITYLWPEQQPFWVWGYVKEGYREQGILNQLHEHVKKVLKDKGFQRFLLSASTNRPEILAMMRRQGHAESGRLLNADGAEEVFFWEDL